MSAKKDLKPNFAGKGIVSMPVYLRIFLVIIATATVITASGLIVGAYVLTRSVSATLEYNLLIAVDIADQYMVKEIEILKMRVADAAREVNSLYAAGEREGALERVGLQRPEYKGFAVFNKETLLDSWGKTTIVPDLVHEAFMHTALSGIEIVSTTYRCPDGVLVKYVAVPMDDELIFVVVLSGHYLSGLTTQFTFWETGHFFINDEDGHVISNIRPEWVETRINFIELAEVDSYYADRGETMERILSGERGNAIFRVGGVPRMSAFRPLSSSAEKWHIGIISPIPEGPLNDIPSSIFLMGVIMIALSVTATVMAAMVLKRPYEEADDLRKAAEVASISKSVFLASMSHEIRTPMNAILGITEILMAHEEMQPEVEYGLTKIYNSCNLLLGIINDILDFSKIEVGKLDIMPALYSTASLINDATQLNMIRIKSRPIEFLLHVSESIPAKLIGDELRIKQILNNLLSNAFKYTNAGQVTLSLDSEPSANEDEVTLVLGVHDTGVGMTKKQLKTLFEEYSRFNHESGINVEGTGLGLPITQRLASLMNGTIHVESEHGIGSLFVVRLPQKLVDNDVLGKEIVEELKQFRLNQATYGHREQITRTMMPYGRVLVVDDVKINLFVAMGLMKLYKLQIETVMSGREAIDRIRSGNVYDIIFMDYMMPEMDGMETTKHLRDLGYTSPIIALTANAVMGQSEIFLQNGFDDFLSKPINIRQLDAILNKFVRDKQPTGSS